MKQSLSLGAQGGWVHAEDQLDEMASAELLATTPYFAASTEVVVLFSQPWGWVQSARARVGRALGPHLDAYVEGQHDVSAQVGQWVMRGTLESDVSAPWYDDSGYTAGGELGVPWTSTLASAAGADFDIEGQELLGVRGSLGYRHPCGCFAAVAWSGHRIARPGVDAWLTVDLIP
jgi:hypothetical protein